MITQVHVCQPNKPNHKPIREIVFFKRPKQIPPGVTSMTTWNLEMSERIQQMPALSVVRYSKRENILVLMTSHVPCRLLHTWFLADLDSQHATISYPRKIITDSHIIPNNVLKLI